MLEYIIKNNNFLSNILNKSFSIFAGIYGYFYNQNKIIKKIKINKQEFLNPYIYEIKDAKKLKAVYAKGFGTAIINQIDYESLNEFKNSNFKKALYLDKDSKQYSSLCDFFILKEKNYEDFKNLNKDIYLYAFLDSLELCKIASENNFTGIIVNGLASLKELKPLYPNLSFICKNPSDSEKALEYADLIIKTNIKN